jgi:hypothetical protein
MAPFERNAREGEEKSAVSTAAVSEDPRNSETLVVQTKDSHVWDDSSQSD